MTSKGLQLALAAALGTAAAGAFAQDFPQRPIRIVLGVAPGGGQDTVARAMAPRLSKALDANIVIDNRPGGSGAIGAELVRRAAADGHTLLMVSASNVINPLLYPVPFDLQRDFAPVAQLVTQPYLLVVTPALPAKSVLELISYGKENPARLSFGSAGNGTVTHLAAELFKEQAQVEALHVPYKGMGQVYPDLIGGRIHAAFSTIVSAQGHVKANRLRALAVSAPKRVKSAPGVPTVAESGLPGFAVTQWYGVLTPAGTERTIVSRLNGAFVAVVEDPAMAEHFAKDGAEAAPSSPDQFGAHLRTERERWARVVQRAGLKGIQ
jgi:tripartite-type tricarboxylate transporter receptor subunit TctC